MINCFLLLACLLFSFAGNLIHKIYNNKFYSSIIDMLYHTLISAIAGFIFSLILSEFIFNPILLIVLSGVGGFLGIQGLDFILYNKFNIKLTQFLSIDNINSLYKKNNIDFTENNLNTKILHILKTKHKHIHLYVINKKRNI